MYGYKTEVSVAPTVQAIDVIVHKPGSVSDLVILQGNLDIQKQVHANMMMMMIMAMVSGPQGTQISGQVLKSVFEQLSQINSWRITVASDCVIVEKILVVSKTCGVLFLQNTGGWKKGMMTHFVSVLH